MDSINTARIRSPAKAKHDVAKNNVGTNTEGKKSHILVLKLKLTIAILT